MKNFEMETGISHVDSDNSDLLYRGYSIKEIIKENKSFEEVAYLILEGEFPDKEELKTFKKELAGFLIGNIPQDVISKYSKLIEMDKMITIILCLLAKHNPTPLQIIAVLPFIVIYIYTIKNEIGSWTLCTHSGAVENYWYSLFGSTKGIEKDLLNLYLILVMEHAINASTFAVRTAASTGADFIRALIAGLAALSGDLHGGALPEARKMFDDIGDIENTGSPSQSHDKIRQ